jgi:hypothetical protein
MQNQSQLAACTKKLGKADHFRFVFQKERLYLWSLEYRATVLVSAIPLCEVVALGLFSSAPLSSFVRCIG